jgi:hypothetical protein
LAPVQPEMRRALARLAAFGVLLCGLFVVGVLVAPHSAHRLRRDLDGLGAWGPLAAIALSALLTCAFVPGPVLAGASGLLFGTAVGTAVAIVSANARSECSVRDRPRPGPKTLRRARARPPARLDRPDRRTRIPHRVVRADRARGAVCADQLCGRLDPHRSRCLRGRPRLVRYRAPLPMRRSAARWATTPPPERWSQSGCWWRWQSAGPPCCGAPARTQPGTNLTPKRILWRRRGIQGRDETLRVAR